MPEVVEMLDRNLSSFLPEKKDYDEIWKLFSAQSNVYPIVALIGEATVGYGCIVIETKIRGGRMGHVEDIVTHEDFTNRGIGRLVLNALCGIAKDEGCYKLALQCKDHNVDFYQKCGYSVSGMSLQNFIV